jgi:hypothetical protein
LDKVPMPTMAALTALPEFKTQPLLHQLSRVTIWNPVCSQGAPQPVRKSF